LLNHSHSAAEAVGDLFCDFVLNGEHVLGGPVPILLPKMVARNSTEVYKGKPVDARQVASALNVGFVLDGSIQRQSGRVR
ncbi:hypothetical protein ACC758_39535, partial [Rhizobium ruizarguesonis]